MLETLIAAALMGQYSMSLDDGCGLPMYRPVYRITSPYEVRATVLMALHNQYRADRAAWMERRRETLGKTRAARSQRRYGTYIRLAERPRKTPAEVQALAEEAWARRMRARARADRARAEGYGRQG